MPPASSPQPADDPLPLSVGEEALRRELERLQALASRERGLLAAILRHTPHGIIVCDPRGRLVLHNEAAERIWAGSASGEGIADWSRYRAFHPDGRPYSGEDWSMARALRDGVVVAAEEVRIERFDGSRGMLLGSAAPIRDAAGEIQGAISVFADITPFKERERALLERERGTADRLARLHAFTAALSEAEDLADVARVTVEHGRAAVGAASGALWLPAPAGHAELAHAGGLERTHDACRPVPPGWDAPAAHALASGEALWASSAAELAARWPEAARGLADLVPGDCSCACLPLEIRAGRVGALSFAWAGARIFSQEERALLLAVARQSAQAVGRARALEAERRARAEAEAAQRRSAFLSEAAALLASSLDWQDTLASVARLAVPRVADWCAVDLVESFRAGPVVVAHVDPAKEELARELGRRWPPDPDAPHGVPNVLRTGAPELHEELPDALLAAAARGPEHLAALRRLDLRSAMVVPMVARGRRLGAITLVSAESGRRFGPADLEMAQHLARRAALAIDNARLYAEAQRAIRARDDVLAIVSHDLRNPLHAVLMASSLLGRPTAAPERARAHAAAIERSARRMGRLIRDLLDSSLLESGHVALDPQPTLAGALLAEATALTQPLAAERGIALEIAGGAEALEVECDRERVLQVLSNLVGNALAFTPEGGRVVLSAAAAPGEVRFAVADTGPGVPPEHRARIFDRYWKSRASRQGTGLGLAIAKGIVEAHGGRIWLESPPGGGATFVFALPHPARPAPSAGPRAP